MTPSEAVVLQQLDPARSVMLATCSQADCMARLATLAGLDRIVWGRLRPRRARGCELNIRVVEPTGSVLALTSLAVEGCEGSRVFSRLQTWDPATLGLSPEAPGGLPVPGPADPPPAADPSGPLTAVTEAAPDVVESELEGVAESRGVRVDAGLRAETEGEGPAREHEMAGAARREPVVPAGTTGRLTVTSLPAGAAVVVDRLPRGETPLRDLRLPVGRHTIEVSTARHETVRRTVDVRADVATRLELKLPPLDGWLSVTSRPPHAWVQVGHEILGTTPIQRRPMRAGEHTLLLSRSGYRRIRYSFVVLAGRDTRLTFRLTERSARDAYLHVTSEPPGARVTLSEDDSQAAPPRRLELLGGKLRLDAIGAGTTPLHFVSPPGGYAVRWTLDGHETVTRRVSVRPRGRHRLHAELPSLRPRPSGGKPVAAAGGPRDGVHPAHEPVVARAVPAARAPAVEAPVRPPARTAADVPRPTPERPQAQGDKPDPTDDGQLLVVSWATLATLSAASFGLTLYFRAEASSEKSAAAACTAGLLTGVRPCPRGIYDQHQRNARVADATADSTTVVACITGAATLATGVAALWWPADQVGQRAGTAPLSVRVLPSLVVLRGRY